MRKVLRTLLRNLFRGYIHLHTTGSMWDIFLPQPIVNHLNSGIGIAFAIHVPSNRGVANSDAPIDGTEKKGLICLVSVRYE